MKADLHMHSTYSDGRLTTEELFKRAKSNEVDIIAITDHDVVNGVHENKEYSKKYGVNYVVGIELSTVEQGKPVHVLGYFKDENYYSKELTDYYKEIQEKREERTRQFIKNLKVHFDIEITYENVAKYAHNIIARPHIAKAIMEVYPEFDHNYIFDHFIGDTSVAYVPSCEISVQEGISLLRRNNCLAVLAHPTILKKHIHDKVLSYDFDGIEARYFRNQTGDEEKYRRHAIQSGMFVTAGADFHGIPNDTKHGDIGEIYIDGVDLEVFLKKLKK